MRAPGPPIQTNEAPKSGARLKKPGEIPLVLARFPEQLLGELTCSYIITQNERVDQAVPVGLFHLLQAFLLVAYPVLVHHQNESQGMLQFLAETTTGEAVEEQQTLEPMRTKERTEHSMGPPEAQNSKDPPLALGLHGLFFHHAFGGDASSLRPTHSKTETSSASIDSLADLLRPLGEGVRPTKDHPTFLKQVHAQSLPFPALPAELEKYADDAPAHPKTSPLLVAAVTSKPS